MTGGAALSGGAAASTSRRRRQRGAGRRGPGRTSEIVGLRWAEVGGPARAGTDPGRPRPAWKV